MGNNEPMRAELYVQSLAPCGGRDTQEAIVKRLLALEQNGPIDDINLMVWGKSVCLDSASASIGVGSHVAQRIRDFHDWCADKRASLDPFFTWSTVDSSIAGDAFHRVVPPQRCLAIYVGDQLRDVYPHSIDGNTRSLEDGLQSIEHHRSQHTDTLPLSEEVG